MCSDSLTIILIHFIYLLLIPASKSFDLKLDKDHVSMFPQCGRGKDKWKTFFGKIADAADSTTLSRMSNTPYVNFKIPWSVFIKQFVTFKGKTKLYGSSGFMVTQSAVVTCGHSICFDKLEIDGGCQPVTKNQATAKNKFVVQHGQLNRSPKNQEYSVSEAYIFSKDILMDSDVGVMILDKPVNKRDFVPLCLPQAVNYNSANTFDEFLFSTGWGVEFSADKKTGKVLYCYTNTVGPAVNKECTSNCSHKSTPVYDSRCERFIKQVSNSIGTHEGLERNLLRKVIVTPKKGKELECYKGTKQNGPFGWCHTRKTWGFCTKTCSFAKLKDTKDMVKYNKDRLQNIHRIKASYDPKWKGWLNTPTLDKDKFFQLQSPRNDWLIGHVNESTNDISFSLDGRSRGFDFDPVQWMCSGDSGAAIFGFNDDYRAVAIGLLARGAIECGELVNDFDFGTRFDEAVLKFIKEKAKIK